MNKNGFRIKTASRFWNITAKEIGSFVNKGRVFSFWLLIYDRLFNRGQIRRYLRNALPSFRSILYNEVKEEMGKEWGETMGREKKSKAKRRWIKTLTAGGCLAFCFAAAAFSQGKKDRHPRQRPQRMCRCLRWFRRRCRTWKRFCQSCSRIEA